MMGRRVGDECEQLLFKCRSKTDETAVGAFARFSRRAAEKSDTIVKGPVDPDTNLKVLKDYVRKPTLGKPKKPPKWALIVPFPLPAVGIEPTTSIPNIGTKSRDAFQLG